MLAADCYLQCRICYNNVVHSVDSKPTLYCLHQSHTRCVLSARLPNRNLQMKIFYDFRTFYPLGSYCTMLCALAKIQRSIHTNNIEQHYSPRTGSISWFQQFSCSYSNRMFVAYSLWVCNRYPSDNRRGFAYARILLFLEDTSWYHRKIFEFHPQRFRS